MSIEEAVERTIDDCIKEGILVDVLTIVKQIGEIIKNANPNSTLGDLLSILMENNIKLDD